MSINLALPEIFRQRQIYAHSAVADVFFVGFQGLVAT